MRTLVLFFSRTGNTAALAKTIASALNADIEELNDQRSWSGFWGAVRAGRAALFGGRSKLAPISSDLRAYDFVILGSPVWASQPSVPLRTFVKDNAARLPHLAVFYTQDGAGGETAVKKIEALTHRRPIASLIHSRADFNNLAGRKQIDAFINELSAFVSEKKGVRAV